MARRDYPDNSFRLSEQPTDDPLSKKNCIIVNCQIVNWNYESEVHQVTEQQPADTRTEAQKASLRRLLEDLHRRYPRALIVGHHDLNPRKDCPCIKDVVREYADLQPKER